MQSPLLTNPRAAAREVKRRPRQPSAPVAVTPDIIVLPSGNTSITDTAEQLFPRIAKTNTMYLRGGVVVSPTTNQDGELTLEVLKPAAARSRFEQYGTFMAWRAYRDGEPVLKQTAISEDMAHALLESEAAQKYLPRIDGLVNCPVIVADGTKTAVASNGYHAPTRLLITSGKPPANVELTEAVVALKELVAEYEFQTPGDRSRAIAAMLTPALKMGGHLQGNITADVAEADKSQSGKTYRQKVNAAIYNEKVALITSRSGGVGSTDESFNAKLIAGRPFMQIDNQRGRYDSPHVEAFLTAERSFPARIPHCKEIEVDPSRFFLALTSNGIETTRDFANRASIVRIRKREGHTFRQYEEGDLLQHVRARQPFYLGCVFAIVREWIAQGRQRTNETRHDFREWVQVLDWIVRNIFGEAPLMDGHQQAQERVSNPALTFLRNIAIAVADQDKLGQRLIASQLYEVADTAEIAIPGLREPDEEKGKRQIGIVMSRLFKATETVEADAYQVQRHETEQSREGGGTYVAKTYIITRQEAVTRTGAQPAQGPVTPEKRSSFPEHIGSCAPCAEPVSCAETASPKQPLNPQLQEASLEIF